MSIEVSATPANVWLSVRSGPHTYKTYNYTNLRTKGNTPMFQS